MKIPTRRFGELGQLTEERIGLAALHRGFGQHRELHPEGVGAELGNLLIGPRLLVAEVVGRKADHHEPTVPVTGVEFLEPLVLLGEPAKARRVDD